MIEHFYRIISNKDRIPTFYLDTTDNICNFFIFNQDSKKLIIINNNYRKKSSNSTNEYYFTNNTYFLIEESTFNHLLPNVLSLCKFINCIDYSIFTTTSSLLIKAILDSKKRCFFHYYCKKGFTYPTTYLSLLLFCTIEKEAYFSMNYTSKCIIVFQDIFDIENMNHFLSTTSPILGYMIHVTLNYYIGKEEIIYILDYKVKSIYYTLYLPYLSYLSMSLDIFNSIIINIIHTSSHIIIRLNLENLIRNYQEELLLSNNSSNFILGLAVQNKNAVEENNNSKLTYFSSKN